MAGGVVEGEKLQSNPENCSLRERHKVYNCRMCNEQKHNAAPGETKDMDYYP